MLMKLTPAVNFIKVLFAHFLYQIFGAITREKLPKNVDEIDHSILSPTKKYKRTEKLLKTLTNKKAAC